LRPAQAKCETPSIIKNKSDVVVHLCDPSFVGGIGRRIAVPDHLGENKRLYLKSN
jgi:hypothetical protein